MWYIIIYLLIGCLIGDLCDENGFSPEETIFIAFTWPIAILFMIFDNEDNY